MKPRTVDFTNNVVVDEDVPPTHIPAGRYKCVIKNVVERESRGETLYWRWELQPIECGAHQDFRLYYLTPFTTKSLHRLAHFIEAVTGLEPQGTHTVNPEIYLGKVIVVLARIHVYAGNCVNEVDTVEFAK